MPKPKDLQEPEPVEEPIAEPVEEPIAEPVEESDTVITLALETLNKFGELFFEAADGRLFYLDQTHNGLYILRPKYG